MCWNCRRHNNCQPDTVDQMRYMAPMIGKQLMYMDMISNLHEVANGG